MQAGSEVVSCYSCWPLASSKRTTPGFKVYTLIMNEECERKAPVNV